MKWLRRNKCAAVACDDAYFSKMGKMGNIEEKNRERGEKENLLDLWLYCYNLKR